MDYQSLHIKTVVELRKLAKLMGVRVPAGTSKSVLIELLLEADRAEAEKAAAKRSAAEAAPAADKPAPEPAASEVKAPENPTPKRRGRPPKARPAETAQSGAPGPAGEVPPAGQAPAVRKAAPRAAKPDGAPANRTEAAVSDDSSRSAVEAPVPDERPAAGADAAAQGDRPAVAAGTSAPTDASSDDALKPAQPGHGTGARTTAAPAVPVRHAYDRPDVSRAPGQGGVRGFGSRYVARPAGSGERPQANALRAAEGAARPPVRAANPRYEPRAEGVPPRRPAPEDGAPEAPRAQEFPETGSARGRREGYYNAEYKTSNPAVPEMLAAGECADGAGVLEIQQDGYGFLRAENCLPGPNDVYISIAQIRRFNLRMGDYVEGKTRPQREGDRYSAMLYITSVNGEPPEAAAGRPRFEDLVPIYPDERIRLEGTESRGDLSLRLVDMLAPIGKGQRGMIVSQPKAGKTTLLKKIANAITARYPEIQLIVLLIDERPEEVTDMKRSIDGEVIYSTFDEEPEHHVRVTEMVLERTQRLVEMGKDVVVLMDSITRLARAYNLVITPTGRSLSGGLDPGALFKPKRFFGAARNIENGGSLTVIATALVDTGSRMDDIIFEEFKGTGNMELHLDRRLSDKRVFPAIDMMRSGTRREELLLSEAELDGEMLVRRVLSGGRGQEMVEQIIDLMSKTSSNADFFDRLRGWLGVFEKEGFTLGGK